jgi:hypothetical protein
MPSSVVDIYNLALQAIGESTLIQGDEDDNLEAEVCRQQYPLCLRSMLQRFAWPWATQQAELNEAVDTYDSGTTYAEDALVRYEGWVFSSVAGSNVGHIPDREDTTYWTPQYPSALGWGYVYSLPVDCVRPVALLLEGERVELKSPTSKLPYTIQQSHDGQGAVLCCNVEPDDLDALEYIAMPQRGPLRDGLTEDDSGNSLDPADFPPMYPPLFVDALVYLLASKIAVPITKNPDIASQALKMHMLYFSEAVTAELNALQKDPDPTPTCISVRE